VYSYDRRGRGDSGDAPGYAVDHEIDDLAAVIGAAGGSARVFGHSSGAVLALAAAGSDVGVERVAAYDAPVTVGDGEPSAVARDLADRMIAALVADRRDEAVRLFLQEVVGLPVEVVGMIEHSPNWDGMQGIAHTLPYDLALTSTPLSSSRLAKIGVPALVIDGADSGEWADQAASALVAAVPGARRLTLAGQTHEEDPAVLAPVLLDFFA
jgi:pimeloyl-ACP methyl ester carboxylesterase